MKITRRQFLDTSARATIALGTAAGVLGTMPAVVLAKEAGLPPIIDTHQHLWDLSKFKPPWLAGAPKVLARSYVTADFLKATGELNVVKAVYMEIDVDPRQQIEEAEHVIALCKSKDHPTAAAVISGRPGSEEFKAYITRFKDSPYIKGVRQVLHVDETKRGLCLQDQYVSSMRLLGKLGMSFDLCMRPTELSDGLKLAQKCPDTRFIVDHCGNADPKVFMSAKRRGDVQPWHQADPWRRDMAALAKQENVICKISGIVARAPKDDWKSDDLAPIINHCLDVFGPDRVVFGGDWPVCRLVATYRQWVTALKEVISERKRSEQRKLLHD
ncbi:MAG: amidohydrolase family protein, partial [Planctomycetes bacterium]|nr:amidohydrolase family protein [Planctomycetota bacterium]